jgi:hypothetical protein
MRAAAIGDQRRTTPEGRRAAQHPGLPRAEISAAKASIAGQTGWFEVQKTRILFGFRRWHGVC